MISRSPVIPSEGEGFVLESFAAVEGPCVPNGTIHTCGVLVFADRSTSTTLKITHFPSGETCGSPTRLSFIMSSNVNGCFACAITGRVNPRIKRKRTRRRMKDLLRQTDECSRGKRAASMSQNTSGTCHPEDCIFCSPKDLCTPQPVAEVLRRGNHPPQDDNHCALRLLPPATSY